MSILYGGFPRIIDLQSWHLWFPWVPIRLTEDQVYKLAKDAGAWRWLWTVERKIDYEKTFGKAVGAAGMGSDPPYTYVWEYRDIGERNAEFGIEGLATA